ncbi:MAG: YkvA family protein [Armatimonadota bacterium]|nr:YkvA family protein [Armatimonadota bacterium]
MTLLKQLWRLVLMARRVGGARALGTLVRQAPQQVALFSRLLRDTRVPVAAKVVLMGALVYAISPLDLIPDWIPVMGELDDLGVALWAINFFLGQIPLDALAEHRYAVGLPVNTVTVNQ